MSTSNGVHRGKSHATNGGLAEKSRTKRLNGKATGVSQPSAAARAVKTATNTSWQLQWR